MKSLKSKTGNDNNIKEITLKVRSLDKGPGNLHADPPC